MARSLLQHLVCLNTDPPSTLLLLLIVIGYVSMNEWERGLRCTAADRGSSSNQYAVQSYMDDACEEEEGEKGRRTANTITPLESKHNQQLLPSYKTNTSITYVILYLHSVAGLAYSYVLGHTYCTRYSTGITRTNTYRRH